MRNKKHLTAYILLTVIPLIVDGFALFFLPDTIPAHYGINGNVDRYGSKFEILIFPVFSVIIAAVLFVSARFSSNSETSTKNNEKIVLVTGECCLSMFMILNFYFLYLALKNVTNIYSLGLDLGSTLCFLEGIFMIVTGNIMPKAKRNSVVGIRFSWTKKNEIIWKKSQHFGGISLVIGGLLLLASAFLFGNIKAIFAVVIITTAVAIACTVYSYIIYKTSYEEN